MDSIFQIWLIVLLATLWILPIVLISREPSIGKKEKSLWIVAMIFGSWLAWILCAMIAPVLPKESAESLRA